MIRSRWAKVAGLVALLFLLAATGRTGAGLRLATAPRAKPTTSLTGPVVLSPAAMAGINHTGTSYVINPTFLTARIRSSGEERTVLEYDLSGITGTVPQSFLGFWLQNGQAGGTPGLLVLSTYAGDGQVTTSDFSAGTPRLSVASDLGLEILNLDVTELVQEAVDLGSPYLGFVLSTSTTDRLEILLYQEPRLTIGGLTTFVPQLNGAFPSSILAGTPGLTLQLLGNNFAPGAIAQWNGSDRPTTGSQVELFASDLASPGVATLTVVNPGPAGGVSNELAFVVRSPVTYFVDDDAPQDPGPNDPAVSDPFEDGSAQHPFDRVQEALDRCFTEDTARVLEGLYIESLTVNPLGGSIVGSGKSVTVIRAPSGPVLSAQSDFLPPYPLILRAEGITFESGEIFIQYARSAQFEDVELLGGSFRFDTYPNDAFALTLNSMRMDSGTLALVARAGDTSTPQLTVTIEGLVAPDTLIDFAYSDPAGNSHLSVTDSIVGGIDFHDPGSVQGGTPTLAVSRVRFGANGLRIRVPDDQGGYGGLIEDSTFHGAGIQIEHRGGLYGGGVPPTVVRGCEFIDAGIVFATGSGDFSLIADANRFDGGGIDIRWARSVVQYDFTSLVRATNNLFQDAPSAISARYEADFPYCDVNQHTGSYRLEAYNNTLVGSGTGVRIQALDPLESCVSLVPVLGNNIVAFGGEGVSVSGFDPEWVTMFTNDVYGNSGPNYVGLADRTGWSGNISLDPLFVDAAAGDFHLTFGSPAIDTGRTLLGLVTTDFDGRPRPLRGRYEGNALTDIGAFEFELAPPADPGTGSGPAPGGRSLLNVEGGGPEPR